MQYRKIKHSEIDAIYLLFSQDILKCADGQFVSENWITACLEGGFGYCVCVEDEIVSALIAEPLLMGGVMLWVIATKPEFINLGYGKYLLSNFEKTMKEIGREWIFLNSTPISKNFYAKNGYSTHEFSLVYEHIKDL